MKQYQVVVDKVALTKGASSVKNQPYPPLIYAESVAEAVQQLQESLGGEIVSGNGQIDRQHFSQLTLERVTPSHLEKYYVQALG